MNLDDTLRLHALKLKASASNSQITELLLERHPDEMTDMKQICARVSIELSDRIDQVCNLLDLSKRHFIELACIEALDRAENHLAETGALEAFSQGKL